MDAKTCDLALLAFLSLFCAISAWAEDRDVFGSAFFALGGRCIVLIISDANDPQAIYDQN